MSDICNGHYVQGCPGGVIDTSKSIEVIQKALKELKEHDSYKADFK